MEEEYDEEVVEEMDMEDRLLAKLDEQIEKEVGGGAEKVAASISNSVFDLSIEERAAAVKSARVRAAASPSRKIKNKAKTKNKKNAVSDPAAGKKKKSASDPRQDRRHKKKKKKKKKKKAQASSPTPASSSSSASSPASAPKPKPGPVPVPGPSLDLKKAKKKKKIARLRDSALESASGNAFHELGDEDMEYSPVAERKRKRKGGEKSPAKPPEKAPAKKKKTESQTSPAPKTIKKKGVPTKENVSADSDAVAKGGEKRRRPAGSVLPSASSAKFPRISSDAGAEKELADLFGDDDDDDDGDREEDEEGEDEVVELEEIDDEDEEDEMDEVDGDDDEDEESAEDEDEAEEEESLYELFRRYLMLIAMNYRAIEGRDMQASGIEVPAPEGPGFADVDAALVDYMRTQRRAIGIFIGRYLDEADPPNKALGTLLRQIGRVVGFSCEDYRVGKIECSIDGEDINAAEAVTWYDRAAKRLITPLAGSLLADPRLHGDALISMGVTYWQADQRDRAVALTEAGAEILRSAITGGLLKEGDLSVAFGNLSTMHAELGDNLAARRYAERAEPAGQQHKRR